RGSEGEVGRARRGNYFRHRLRRLLDGVLQRPGRQLVLPAPPLRAEERVARLIYSAIASLDGYVADTEGKFGWARPDEEVHQFVNDRDRPIGTYLYGRLMYETMVAWETWQVDDEPAAIRDYAQIWRAAEKVVYSRTLDAVASERTRIERKF